MADHQDLLDDAGDALAALAKAKEAYDQAAKQMKVASAVYEDAKAAAVGAQQALNEHFLAQI